MSNFETWQQEYEHEEANSDYGISMSRDNTMKYEDIRGQSLSVDDELTVTEVNNDE